MSRMPTDSWLTTARPDLPEYELNAICANPDCSRPGVENHHLWRRSLGAGFREAYWVELDDGTVLPNRVGLCHDCHRLVTDNEVRIFYYAPDPGLTAFFWGEPNGTTFLDPQPGPPMQSTLDGGAVPHSEVVLPPDEQCPKCKGRGRLPREPKREHEPAAVRPKAVLSVRVPRDEMEDGHEVLTSLIDAARERLAPEMGWTATTPPYYVLVAVLSDWLSSGPQG